MQKLLEYLVSQITDQDKIKVTEASDESGIISYTIFAPKEVMGLLIGKGGKTIRAIRSVARARAIIDQVKINIELSEAV